MFPPLGGARPERAVRQWGDDVAAPWTTWPAPRPGGAPRGSPGRSTSGGSAGRRSRPAPAPRNTQGARWNPRGQSGRGVAAARQAWSSIPWRELTAPRRAVAPGPDGRGAGDEPLDFPASFGESYAAMLGAGGAGPPAAAEPAICPARTTTNWQAPPVQDHLKRQAAARRPPAGERYRHLADLSGGLQFSELVRKRGGEFRSSRGTAEGCARRRSEPRAGMGASAAAGRHKAAPVLVLRILRSGGSRRSCCRPRPTRGPGHGSPRQRGPTTSAASHATGASPGPG